MKNLRRSFLTLLIFLILHHFSNAQTNVSGGIYTNTTWTLANSPYIVVDTVVVFPGVTLTIEPGVTVKFADGKRIEIRQAYFNSEGTVTDSITYTSNSATPTPGIYIGLYFNGYNSLFTPYKFNYCHFSYAGVAISDAFQPIIKNSKFDYNNNSTVGVNGLIIDSCNFMFNSSSVSGSGIISNSNFLNNSGLPVRHEISLINCIFISNQNGPSIDGSLIQNCIFKHNSVGIGNPGAGPNIIKNCVIDSNTIAGISTFRGDSIIGNEIKYNGTGISISLGCQGVFQENVIENNDTGIYLACSNTIISCNRICNTFNVIYNVPFGSNTDLINNYWCTTDSVAIDSTIYDGYDNISLGLVHFQPVDSLGCYLTGCLLGVAAHVTNATCDTCPNGSATAVISNGHPPYTYTWYTSPIQYTQTATGLTAGTYQLCVVDGNGCTACNNNIFVDSTNCHGFSIVANGTNETCLTCADGSATVIVNGGTPPYHYSWYTTPMQSTQTATGISHGRYAVCVTDLYGCSACDSVTIGTGNCSAHFNLYPDTVPHTYIGVNMASGVAPITYDWNWGDGSPHDTAAYPNHTYATAGFYSICLTITDSAGCSNTYCNSFYLLSRENAMIYVNVVPAVATGINTVAHSQLAVSVFPNPANEYLTLKFSEAVPSSQVKIYNVLGEVKSFSTLGGNVGRVDLRQLASGVYFIEVANATELIRQRFIKE